MVYKENFDIVIYQRDNPKPMIKNYEKVSDLLPYKQRKVHSFLGLVFWLTLRDKNIETFLDKAIERAEDYLYLKRRVLKVRRIDITSRLKSVRDDNEKRILKCQEDNRIWYQIWITQLDMNCIERYFDGYGEVKRW